MDCLHLIVEFNSTPPDCDFQECLGVVAYLSDEFRDPSAINEQ